MTNLTPAELGVLHLMALGMSDKMTAAVLGIATSTVKGHISTANLRLGTGNRIGILLALGWLTPPDHVVTEPRPRKTHCLRGHPLTDENLTASRRCRACRRIIERRRWHPSRKRAA